MSVGLGTPAHAEDWKVVGQFGWFGVGKAYEIERGHVYWVGEFNGTFFNDKGKGSPFDRAAVKCPAYNDIDANQKKNTIAGYCIIADTDGDQAYVRFQAPGRHEDLPRNIRIHRGNRQIQRDQRQQHLRGSHAGELDGWHGFWVCDLESLNRPSHGTVTGCARLPVRVMPGEGRHSAVHAYRPRET